MAQESRILKKGAFKLTGPRRLGSDVPPVAVTSDVRIVADGPESVLLEVTCACGRKARIQCDYAPAPTPAPGAE